MSFTKYDYVLTVAELQSFSQAAKKLYISQPALTKIINGMEAELGVKLFNRNVIPIQVTHAGERFIAAARQIVEIERQLRRDMLELSDSKRGRISIGVGSNASSTWIPIMMPLFKREYPLIDIQIVEGSHIALVDRLLKETVDFIFTSGDFHTDDVVYEPLNNAPVFLFVPRDNPPLRDMTFDYMENSLDNPVVLPPERLNGADFVMMEQGFSLHRLSHQIFERNSIRVGNILYLNNAAAAYRIAATGTGSIFATPYSTHYTLPGMVPVVCTIEVPPPLLHNKVGYKRGRKLTGIERTFITMAQKELMHHPLLLPLSASKWRELKNVPFP